MLVYDITDLESFQNLTSWLIEIEKNANKNVNKILVGNKSDLENERKVSMEQGKGFALQHGMKFYETSAKNSYNVFDSFQTLAKEIIKDKNKKKNINKNNNNNNLFIKNPEGKAINNKGCC